MKLTILLVFCLCYITFVFSTPAQKEEIEVELTFEEKLALHKKITRRCFRKACVRNERGYYKYACPKKNPGRCKFCRHIFECGRTGISYI